MNNWLYCLVFLVCITSADAFSGGVHSHYLKPGAPIQIVGEQSITIEANNPQLLTVRFSVSQLRGSAEVTVRPDEGLNVGGSELYTFDLASDSLSIPLELSAVENGIYYIHFHAQIEGLSRAMAYRVQVGDTAPVQQKATSSGGIKSFAAQETILTK